MSAVSRHRCAVLICVLSCAIRFVDCGQPDNSGDGDSNYNWIRPLMKVSTPSEPTSSGATREFLPRFEVRGLY